MQNIRNEYIENKATLININFSLINKYVKKLMEIIITTYRTGRSAGPAGTVYIGIFLVYRIDTSSTR